MAESLSSVPPVWPSPRPEIIGTKAPQAATIGASIRLTLSPTPPLECLSMIGPGRSRSFQSRTTPDRTRPSVSATLSAVVMPRKNTAMAKAATWPSLRVESVMPRAMRAISSAESSCPSRFLRMISCGSMRSRVACEEAPQQPPQVARGGIGRRDRLLVADAARHHAGGIVGHHRDADDLHAGMARDDGFRRRRHPDGVGPQHAGGADLGRRLEARAAEPDIDAGMKGDAERLRRRDELLQQRRIIGVDHVDEAPLSVAEQRI